MTSADRPTSPPGEAVDESTGRRELLWGVGAVSSMLGIATPTLRTWDRRYDLGPSRRTQGGHRRYTESDITRVELMRRLVDHGVPAQQAASVALTTEEDELSAPLDVVTASRTTPETEPDGARTRTTAGAAAAIVDAAAALDSAALGRQLGQVFEHRGVVAGWVDVVVPALRMIGQRWRNGELGIEVEHLVSERVATELRSSIRTGTVRRSASQPVLLAGAPDDYHVLPLLVLEAALGERRVLTVALGAATTPSALAKTVMQCDPRAVFVWASMPRGAFTDWLPPWPHSPRPRLLVLGGPGWPEGDLGAPPWVQVTRTHDLPSALATLAGAA